jgi:hypothetical protein
MMVFLFSGESVVLLALVYRIVREEETKEGSVDLPVFVDFFAVATEGKCLADTCAACEHLWIVLKDGKFGAISDVLYAGFEYSAPT